MFPRLLALLILSGLHGTPGAGGRKRWAGKTAAERSAEMTKVAQASARTLRERKIAGLIESAPPMTAAQKAKLAELLDAVPEVVPGLNVAPDSKAVAK